VLIVEAGQPPAAVLQMAAINPARRGAWLSWERPRRQARRPRPARRQPACRHPQHLLHSPRDQGRQALRPRSCFFSDGRSGSGELTGAMCDCARAIRVMVYSHCKLALYSNSYAFARMMQPCGGIIAVPTSCYRRCPEALDASRQQCWHPALRAELQCFSRNGSLIWSSSQRGASTGLTAQHCADVVNAKD